MARRFVRDSVLRREIKSRPCIICGTNMDIDPCHIATFGARGLEEDWAMVPMCRKHHQEQHLLGWKRFCEKYPMAGIALRVRGWEFIEAHGKFWLKNPLEKEHDAHS